MWIQRVSLHAIISHLSKLLNFSNFEFYITQAAFTKYRNLQSGTDVMRLLQRFFKRVAPSSKSQITHVASG